MAAVLRRHRDVTPIIFTVCEADVDIPRSGEIDFDAYFVREGFPTRFPLHLKSHGGKRFLAISNLRSSVSRGKNGWLVKRRQSQISLELSFVDIKGTVGRFLATSKLHFEVKGEGERFLRSPLELFCRHFLKFQCIPFLFIFIPQWPPFVYVHVCFRPFPVGDCPSPSGDRAVEAMSLLCDVITSRERLWNYMV